MTEPTCDYCNASDKFRCRSTEEAEACRMYRPANGGWGSGGVGYSDRCPPPDLSHLRWDRRFMTMAGMVASWSKDPSTQCGAVIVRPDRTVVSTGFNGFPRGCNDAEEMYNDRELKYARVVHAEMNAMLSAREPLNGYTLYVHSPGFSPCCSGCAAAVIQTGITRVVGWKTEFVREASLLSVTRGLNMFEEAGVEVTMMETADG